MHTPYTCLACIHHVCVCSSRGNAPGNKRKGRHPITLRTKSIISHLGKWEAAVDSQILRVGINRSADSTHESEAVLSLLCYLPTRSQHPRLCRCRMTFASSFLLVHCSSNRLQEGSELEVKRGHCS